MPAGWLSWRRWPSYLVLLAHMVKWISSDLLPIPPSTTWALCFLGIAAAALIGVNNPDPTLNLSANIALNGAVLQMFAHGLSAAGMFFLVGVIYERTHTRNLKEYGGLFPLDPGLWRHPHFYLHGFAGSAGDGRLRG